MDTSRIIYWAPIFLFSSGSIILDVRLLYTIFLKTQSSSYRTFFFRFFATQVIKSVISSIMYKLFRQ